jgi:diacylglycerol kinase (ATP)
MQTHPTFSPLRELARWRNTAAWSLSGLRVCWIEEKSLRQWACANLASWCALGFSGFATVEIALLVALGGLTIIVELLNSAIEATVDYISTERHPLAGKAKDIASAAVMAAALLWGGVWALLLLG